MKKIAVVFAASTLILLSCSKHEIRKEVGCTEEVRIPESCAEYEEMKANGEDLSRYDHWATCKCPIKCHFDDMN